MDAERIIGICIIIISILAFIKMGKRLSQGESILPNTPIYPDTANLPPDALVTVCRFHNAFDADLWKMRLQSEGIECVLQTNRSVGAELRVMAKDAERALEILREMK